MTYKEVVKKVLDKVIELNSENIEVTMSKDQLTCWFLDDPYIHSSVLVEIENKGDTYEIICWNKNNNREVITVDDIFKMLKTLKEI